MKLLSIELANFRKFRRPIIISGFSDALNIVVEPNETGKSTLLEALRAAFFIRHSAKSELVRSFCPFGDDVAPKVAIQFEIDAAQWRIEKQFLKAPYAALIGPDGRIESDAAEERLQTLLGFEKGNNRGSDPEVRGALGLLWVEQASALSVEAPNRLVRENIRSALEAEVGMVLGGRRFELVTARVEEAYATYRTAKSGKATGKLAAAEAVLESAIAQRDTAAEMLRAYNQALSQLEEAKTAKRLVERDLADPELAECLRQLREDLKVAETAQLRLSNATARHGETEAALRSAEQWLQRYDSALNASVRCTDALAIAERFVVEQQTSSAEALDAVTGKREILGAVRAQKIEAEAALDRARTILAQRERSDALNRARAQLVEVHRIEARVAERELVAQRAIDAEALAKLAILDRKAIEARILFETGAVGLDIELRGDVALLIDGDRVSAGHRDLVRPTEIVLDKVARIVLTPPSAGGLSAEANLRSAEEALTSALAALDVSNFAEARGRVERGEAAAQEIATLKQQIETLCPGEPVLALAPGSIALKALLSDLAGAADVMADEANIDVAALDAALQTFREEERVALARLEAAQLAAHEEEKRLVQLQAERAAAAREADAATQSLVALQAEAGRDAIDKIRGEASEELARRSEALEQARQSVTSFDADRIRKNIANIEREQVRGREERLELAARIASLETTIASDGHKGPATIASESEEVAQAAAARLSRLVEEANALELLRKTLREVGDETSRTFLGPVTRRAARYVERILPGSTPEFDEEMSLVRITRGGTAEASSDLSRGTQEQLAVLTRLAFADLLLEKGAPVSLILDDPLVYSDDGRFEVMTDILAEAAARMQVILFTCRAKAFRHVAAHRIALTFQD
jgi:AAA domain